MQHAPSAERNKEPILKVLQQHIPVSREGLALEIASGTGQHVSYLAPHFKNLAWQPSEFESSLLPSISAYIQHTKAENIRQPVKIDVTSPVEEWNDGKFSAASCDVVINFNMIHISPWAATVGLFKACGFLLKADGVLFTYGAYAVDGMITPESNVNFDQSLKSRNPEWGLRDIRDVQKLAEENGLQLNNIIDMPSNNKTLIFQRKV